MDPFTYGLIFSGVSAIGNAIGSSRESAIRSARKEALRKAIFAAKQKTLEEGVARISGLTAAQMASARSGAARRATALGQASEAESFILPAEQQVGKVGGQLTRDFVTDTSRSFDQQLIDVERDAANDPIPLGATDILTELGASAFKGYLAQQELDLEKERTRMMGKAYGSTGLGLEEGYLTRDRGYEARDKGYLLRNRARRLNQGPFQ